MDCDLIVIGSGFGGSVCALRAADAGMRVIVVERGGRMTPAAYDDLAAGQSRFIRRADSAGIFDLHIGPGLASLTGCAVGGGSHVYTAVTTPTPPEIFAAHWPSGLNAESLRPYYERVERVIAPSPIPHAIGRTRAVQLLGQRMGARTTVLPVAVNWPGNDASLDCSESPTGVRSAIVEWLRGGRACRKRTLDQTYLAQAEKCGAAVHPLREASAIIPMPGGYRVACRRLGEGYIDETSFTAPCVILAAGTLNTLRLLFSCRDRLRSLPNISNALGRRFFTNGDFGGLLINPQIDLPPDSGPPVTSWIDLWKESRLFLMETGAFCGTGLRPVETPTRRRRHTTNRLWSFGVMGFGETPSQINLEKNGRLHRSASYDPFERVVRQRLRDLAEAAGAQLLMPPRWLLGRRSISVHPLGGAAMANSPDHGVTDPFGEVFGCPGLFIADGSLLPTPTGVPPSMTIAALAERVIETIVKTCR